MNKTSQLRRGRSRTGQGRKGSSQNRGQNRHNQSRQNPGRVKQQATQAMEKYLNLFREARISGDRIEAENYRQHADHYFRVVAEANAQLAEMQEAKAAPVADERQENSGEAKEAALEIALSAEKAEQPADKPAEKQAEKKADKPKVRLTRKAKAPEKKAETAVTDAPAAAETVAQKEEEK